MESIRRLIRKILGPHSKFYRAGAAALDFFATMRSDGFATWYALRRIKNGRHDAAAESVTLKNAMHPMSLRPGTEDVSTVLNNVVRQEYGQFAPDRQPRWMIDAGAYIGDTCAYFLSRFDDLRVIALEPDPENYAM